MAKDSFEKDLKRLEDIVAKMEEGDVPLDESMKLFEEGVKLSRLCSERLDKAEKKVEIITADKNGNITTRPFEAES
jgi:exodeoxyribonuclease VII small subunit